MNTSTELHELAPALAIAQGQIKAAIKESVNPHFKSAANPQGSRYADLSAVWDACRAALSANGLSVVQMPTDVAEGRVGLTTMLLHASGQYISNTVSVRLPDVRNAVDRDGRPKADMGDAQAVGSALTYLRRYALAAMVGVVADEDDDGNAATTAAPTQPRPQADPNKPSAPTVVKGKTVTGVISDVKLREKDGLVTARYTIDGVRYISARLDVIYNNLMDGDQLTITVGNPANGGETWADIAEWCEPTSETA